MLVLVTKGRHGSQRASEERVAVRLAGAAGFTDAFANLTTSDELQ